MPPTLFFAAALTGLATVTAVAIAGCGGDDELGCEEVVVDCLALYAPTYDNVFHRTLVPKCGSDGANCHSPDGRRGGLYFDEADPEGAYQRLMDPAAGLVIPGDASCSEITARVTTAKSEFMMPLGMRLNAQEICAMVQWVEQGALPGGGQQ